MATVGRINNAAVHGTQETTFSLANVNFNFSIVTLEAPSEYRGLGSCLSAKRKSEAEDGLIHSTARKLGVLFESVIPEVPALIEAYGHRVSEIAATSTVNPQGNNSHGAFADHVGADGTSIWATATSGKKVVTIHLLACMLARMFRRPEAVSIWSELVAKRKAILEKHIKTSDSFSLSELTASRIRIGRDQLDEWDASARSWLLSADEAKALQHTNLRLIKENVNLPVSQRSEVYGGVLEVWTRTMQALENLILGRPQRINSGDILLGISSWHIYPDMMVLRDKETFCKQNDRLVNPGGVITIGLEGRDDEQMDGIYWSLPLAHMRYYGEPVTTTRYAGLTDSQVPFDQFRYVILGSVLSTWGPPNPDSGIWIRIIKLLSQGLSAYPIGKTTERDKDALRWLKSLADCCSSIEQSDEQNRKKQLQLINYGKRNCASFLAHRESHPYPVFDLTNMQILLSSMGDDTSLRIKFLRTWACMASNRIALKNSVIRYRDNSRSLYSYTNVFSARNTNKKRSSHTRDADLRQDFFHWKFESEEQAFHSQDMDAGLFATSSENIVRFPPKPGYDEIDFEFVCGDESIIAIFRPIENNTSRKTIPNRVSVQELLRCLEKGELKVEKLIAFLLRDFFRSKWTEYFSSLELLYDIGQLYLGLPGAVVDLQVTSREISKTAWSRLFHSKRNSEQITHGPNTPLICAFCCIAMLETGFLDVDPQKMEGVMAISYNNSLYVAKYLLEDPTRQNTNMPVTRITGNIGKPGFALLVTPKNPKIRETRHSFQVINHAKCDGRPQDSFTGTSLHLSMTGYELPLDVGVRGNRDAEAVFVETAISLYDQGQWVADLEIPSPKHLGGLMIGNCPHNPNDDPGFPHDLGLKALDGWAELLELPDSSCVLRAFGNPMARLAATALSAQRGYFFRVLPENGCWSCGDFLTSTNAPTNDEARAEEDPEGSEAGSSISMERPEISDDSTDPPNEEHESPGSNESGEPLTSPAADEWLQTEGDPDHPRDLPLFVDDINMLSQEDFHDPFATDHDVVVYIW